MANKIALLTDSGSDLNNSVIKDDNLFVLPLQVIIDGVEYNNSNDLDVDSLYEDMKNKTVTTSLPSPNEIHATIERIIAQGYTHIIAITISSGLSGTHNIIKLIASEFTNISFEVIDTKNISFGSGLLGLQVLRDIKDNLPFDMIVHRVNERLSQSRVFFTVGTLDYLKRGGRIGKVAGTVAETLNIKPVISCNPDGVYYTVKKIRGYQRSINLVIECAREFAKQFKKVKVVLLSVKTEMDLSKLTQQIHEQIDNIAEFSIETVSPALGVHTGPEVIGVALINYE